MKRLLSCTIATVVAMHLSAMPIGLRVAMLGDNYLQEFSDLLPDLGKTPSKKVVVAAVSGLADDKIAKNILDVESYAAYREWVFGLEGVAPEHVKDSSYSWLSYALDVDSLISAAPKKKDVVIDTFESTATDGTFEFTLKIDGIEVGDNALEANIRKVFDIEGVEKLVSGGVGFSVDNAVVNAATPDNKNIKFSVMPKVENGEKPNSFFFRVKMKQ